MNKRKIAKLVLGAGILALCWLLEVAGVFESGDGNAAGGASGNTAAMVAAEAPPPSTPQADAVRKAALPSTPQAETGRKAAPPSPADDIVRDGEYCDRERVAAYIRKFNGRLPRNYITKAEARELGWQGGPLEPFAPGKSIGGDRFGNYERKLPNGQYKECDIDTRGKSRGVKRLIYTHNGKAIYYTGDHYETFEEVFAR